LGKIVVERDHVLIVSFLPLSFICSTLSKTWEATKGPFFKERGILNNKNL
jgi:hypothetical protein